MDALVGLPACMSRARGAKIAAGELFETEEGGAHKMTSHARALHVIKFR